MSTSESWRKKGACRKVDPAIFFPNDEESVVPAQRICAQCPVREPCLEWALQTREPNGVWGGASKRERDRILKNRRRQGLI